MSSRLHVSQKYAEECCDNINSERRVASLALLDGRFSSALQSLSKTSPHYKNWQAAVCHVFAGRADEVNLYLSRTNWSCLVPAHVPLSGPVRYERVGWAHTPESRKVQNNLGEREGVSEWEFLGFNWWAKSQEAKLQSEKSECVQTEGDKHIIVAAKRPLYLFLPLSSSRWWCDSLQDWIQS